MKKNQQTICWWRISWMSYIEAESACDMFMKISRWYVDKESACDNFLKNQQAIPWWRRICRKFADEESAGCHMLKLNQHAICLWKSAWDMFIKISRRYVDKESACAIFMKNQHVIFLWRIRRQYFDEESAAWDILRTTLEPRFSCSSSLLLIPKRPLYDLPWLLLWPWLWVPQLSSFSTMLEKTLLFLGFSEFSNLNLGKLLTKLYHVKVEVDKKSG